ncbi:hypothetical protein PA05_0756 [Cutibacterium acnes P05]|nr:hypothetical protein [Cutibacterium acnes P05]
MREAQPSRQSGSKPVGDTERPMRWRRTAAHDPAAITSRVGVSNPRLEAAR